MSLVVVHNSPHIAITRSLSRSTYDNFKLLKNLATTRRQKWEERKSYQSRSALIDCRTDLALMSWLLAKHGDIAQVPTSCVRVATSCYELLRYNTISKPSSDELLREAYELLRYDTTLKPSSDELTTIFLRVSAITVRLSTSCLQISTSW